ncbi:MAG: DUF427 domain-containing protein [Microbacterium sp.]
MTHVTPPSGREPIASDRIVRRDPPLPATWTWEPSRRWVRGWVGETAVADSRRPILTWEPGAKVAEYGFPVEDVRSDLLEPGDPPTVAYYRPRRPARRWLDLVLDDRRIPAAAWTWDLDELDGFIALSWYPGVLDRWTEEEDAVFAHPRDPHSRVDTLTSSRHVVVREGERILADSTEPVIVYETGLPPRYYLPPSDVDWSSLRPVTGWSECPYKGEASQYWASADELDREIAWSYPAPLPVVAPIAGLIAFYSERISVEVDGVVV